MLTSRLPVAFWISMMIRISFPLNFWLNLSVESWCTFDLISHPETDPLLRIKGSIIFTHFIPFISPLKLSFPTLITMSSSSSVINKCYLSFYWPPQISLLNTSMKHDLRIDYLTPAGQIELWIIHPSTSTFFPFIPTLNLLILIRCKGVIQLSTHRMYEKISQVLQHYIPWCEWRHILKIIT